MIRIVIVIIVVFLNQTILAQTDYEKIDSLIKAYIQINKFNGNVLVIKNGTGVYEKSYGYSNKAMGSLISSESIFPIGSLTKPFTATLILKLIEQGKLSIDDPISKFIEDYPRGNEITIKHLLTHTSGVFDALQNPKYFEKITTTQEFTNAEKMSFFKNYPLDFEPGTKFSYSNSGYDLLGIIIEKVTGTTYYSNLKKCILTPLGMRNTGFNYRLIKSSRKKVTGYSYLSKSKQIETKLWNPYLLISSGALYSSTEDLLKFYYGIIDNKIISKDFFSAATRPHLGGYGFGWFIDSIGEDIVVNHGGNIEGFTSYFLMNKENGICIILLNNITSNSLEKTGNSIYRILTNKPYTLPAPKKEILLKQDLMLSYTGSYEVSKDYKAKITLDNLDLFIQINNEPKMKLLAEKENIFFIKDEDISVEFILEQKKIGKLKMKQGLSTKIADKVE